MLRKLGKQILLISIPLFILLLIYRNHGQLAKYDKLFDNQTYDAVTEFTYAHQVSGSRPKAT